MGRPILSPGKKLTGEKTDRYTGTENFYSGPLVKIFRVYLVRI